MDAQSLTLEPIPVLIRRLAIPASLGMIFNTLYNVVDTYYAGLISTETLAALSSSSFLFFFIIGLAYGGTTALSAMIGHAYGRKHFFYASMLAKKGVAFVLALGAFLGVLGSLALPWLLKLIAVQESYFALALSYMRITLLGTVFFFANFAFNSVLVAIGDTKSYRNTLIFGFFANIILNPLFIYGWAFIPPLGIGGIAFSTVLIQLLNALYLLEKVRQSGLITFTCKKHFYPHAKVYRQFIAQATPPGLNMLMISLGSLIALHFVSVYGYKAVAGYGIGYRVEQLMLLPALGIASATLSLVANNKGAGKIIRVKETFVSALKYGYTLSLLGMFVMLVCSTWIVSRFDDDANVVSYGSTYIHVMLFLFCSYVTHFVCVSTLQGIKQPIMIFYVGFFRQLFAPALVYTLIVYVWKLSFVWIWIGLGVIVYSSALFLLSYTFQKVNRHLKGTP
jgi:putative MATE family efflux protein